MQVGADYYYFASVTEILQNTMEFVKFKENSDPIGVRVVEGWVLSYSIEFREWAPVEFECFPAVNGVAWKTHFGGTRNLSDYRSQRRLEHRLQSNWRRPRFDHRLHQRCDNVAGLLRRTWPDLCSCYRFYG